MDRRIITDLAEIGIMEFTIFIMEFREL